MFLNRDDTVVSSHAGYPGAGPTVFGIPWINVIVYANASGGRSQKVEEYVDGAG